MRTDTRRSGATTRGTFASVVATISAATRSPATSSPAMIAAATLALTLAAACSTPTTADGMRLDAGDLQQLAAEGARLDHLPPIDVRTVTGGAETSALGSPSISSTDFARALGRSLVDVGPARTGTEPRRLALDAEILELDSPPGARDMPAQVTVRYRLFDANADAPHLDRTIRTGFLVPRDAAFTDVERLRLALEGAARNNIETFVRGLAQERDRQ